MKALVPFSLYYEVKCQILTRKFRPAGKNGWKLPKLFQPWPEQLIELHMARETADPHGQNQLIKSYYESKC
jgi:hypothetical protein